MSSLIAGYEYDIFISYRQKDNRGEQWVSEFVEALKTELESTFKEEISIYFDINPHDGLLETHDVDESLKNKLKCLVFIPIISRTYCDPKSFAWEHEFKAFVELASHDQFGLKVKLPNGNVASRVLPIRIYDLDNNDIRLCESVLGSVLRGIEFIYKEPGVNRPLKPDDDEKKNLNKAKYRNQINKTANAIRDIITALENYEHEPEIVSKDLSEPVSIQLKTSKTKIIAGSLVLLAFIVLAFFFIPKLFKSEREPEKSIAVLPFHNYSGDPAQEYMCNGLTDEIIGHLYKIKSFDRVVSLSSVLTYKGTDKRLPRIADELNVNYILEGTYKKIGDQIRVTAQLIEPKRDRHIWQSEYDRPYQEIIAIQADIALQITEHLRAFLTGFEKKNIQNIPTTNQEAYDLLQRAMHLWNTRSYDSFDQLIEASKKVIEEDPDYATAYAWLGGMTILKGTSFGGSEMRSVAWEAASYFHKARELDNNNAGAHIGMAMINDYFNWDYITAESEFLKAIELSPNEPNGRERYSEFLLKRGRPGDAISYIKNVEMPLYVLTKAQVISGAISGKKREAASSIRIFLNSQEEHLKSCAGEFYLWIEEYEAAKLSLETAKEEKDNYMLVPSFQACLALAYFKTGGSRKAQTIINQLINKSNETLAGSPDYYIGWYYSGIGKPDSAFYWLEKAYNNRSPEMPWLKVDHVFKNIMDDPRYRDLYERTGHKAYDDYFAVMKK